MRGIRRVLGHAVWLCKGIIGEGAYDRYVEHARRAHPDAEPMCARDFWRARYRDADANPGTRCC